MLRTDNADTHPMDEMTTGQVDHSQHPSQDEIARLAYHLYETQGKQDGHDLDNWLRAERELLHYFANQSSVPVSPLA